MAVFKATENKKKTTTGSFQATGQRSYNTSAAYGWEKASERASRTISRLNEKARGGGYLSADDLKSYRSAVNSYIGSTSRLRTLGASFGQKYDDDWESQSQQLLGGIRDLEDYYSQWDSEDTYNQAKKYAAIPQSADFDQYRGYANASKGWTKHLSDPTYEYINGKLAFALYDAIAGVDANYNYDKMTENEISVYNYVYAKEGKEKAEEYLKLLDDTLVAREKQETTDDFTDFATKHPALSSVTSVPLSLLSGYEYADNAIKYLAEQAVIGEAELGPSYTALASNTIRGTVSEKVNWEINNWDAFDFLYNTAMSGADSLTSGLAFGNLGGTVLGLSAAAQATNDALDRGMSDEQAFWNGLVSGTFEGLFETVSIGNLNSLKEVAPDSVKDIIKNLGKSMLVNASEEMLTELANITYDTLANGEFANYTLEELKNGAWKEAAAQIAEAGASGALMGVGMGTVGNSIGYFKGSSEAKAIYGSDPGALVGEALEIDPNNAYAQKMQGKLDSSKSLSGGQINHLVRENEAALTAQDTAAIQQATQQRLEQLGETGDAAAISAAIAKQVAGQELTRAEQKTIQNSKYGQQVASELSPENVEAGNADSQWAKGIGTQRVHPEVYTGEQTAPQAAKTETAERAAEEKTAALTDTQAAAVQENRMVEAVPQKVTGIRNGKVTVQAADGKQYDAGKITYATEDEAQLWQTVGSYQNITPKAANTIIHARKLGNQSITDYLTGAAGVYRSGYTGAAVMEKYAQKLTPGQRELIYDAGKQAAGENVARREAEIRSNGKNNGDTSKGAVHYDGDRSKLNETQKASLDTMEMLAKALGVQIHVFESGTNEKGEHVGANGWYDRSDGSIHIDLYAGGDSKGTMLFTMAHELTHFIYQWSPAKFKVLANFLMEQYTQQGVTVDELIENQQKTARKDGRQIDEETAFEEVVAASMESMLTDGNVVQMMADLRQQDKSLWQKIRDWFRDIAGKIKAVVAAYKDVRPDSAEGKMVADMQDVIVILESLYADALAEASGNFAGAQKNTAEDGGVRYSLRAFEDGVRFVDVQTDPSIFEGMTVAEMNRKAKSILVEKFAGRVIGLDNRVFVNGDSVNEYLHPSKSIDIDTRKTKLTAAGELDNLLDAGTALPNEQDGKDGHIHPDVIDFSYYRTIFKLGSEYFEGIVNVKNIKRGKLLKDVTKIRNITKDIVSSYGNNPKSNFLRDASMDSIRNGGENVNKRFSTRQRDQDYLSAVEHGDMDTAQKMVDQAAKEAGYNSPILYHGTRSFGFTEFDLSKMDDKRSIFLTDNERIAATYSGVMGKRNVSGEAMKPMDDLSTAELVEELNSDRFGTEADADDKYLYSYLSLKDINQFIGKVNSEIDALQGEVAQLIRQYADRMATDFDSKDHRTHEQLVKLERLLHGYAYRDISTQLYMLLHYTDAFNETESDASRIAQLEQDIRLFNKLEHRDNSDGAIVESWLNGYSLNVLDKQQARDKLEVKRKTCNYGLYAKLENALVIDADGAVWNDIRHWYHALGITARSTQVERRGDSFALIDKASGEEIAEGRFAVNPYTESMPAQQRHAYMVDKAQATLSIVTENMNNTRDIAAFAQKRGYDGVIFRNLRDNGGHNAFVGTEEQANTYVLFDPKQAKSADPVTYDNDGNVIPLSERFNSEKTDIRFSAREKRDSDVDAVLRKENEQLKADVEELKQMLKLQRTVTGGTKFTQSSVEAAARMLKKQNEASGSTEELAAMLNRFYEYIASEKELTWEGVLEQAREAADWLEQNRKHKRSEYAQDILDQIHGNRIYLDESQKAEAEYRFGSYNDFRKSIIGNIVVANDANMSLDSFWQEMACMYPNEFSLDTVSTDMPSALVDIIEKLRNADTSTMEYAYNSELHRQDLLRQVYDSYWQVSTLYTFADTKQAEIKRLKGEHYARMNQLRTDTREQLERLKQQHRQELAQVRQEYREKAEKQRQEISQRYQESRKKATESRHRTEMRHKIQRVVKELNQYLLSGTKDKHVPIELQKAVAEALDAVNMDTVGAQERIAKLQQELSKAKTEEQRNEILRKIESVRSMGERMDEKLKRMKDAYDEFLESDDPLIANAHDDAISGHMMTLIVKVGDTPLRDMSMDQLQAVYDVYQIVLTTVRNANKAFKAARNATISELGQNVMREIYDAGGKKQQRAQAMDMVNRFGWNNLKPVYAFSAMGSNTFSEIFDNVRAGEDVWARDVRDARAFYLQKVDKHHYNDWDFEKRYQFTSTSGMDFELGLEQIMSLYAYSKREQAADHLKRGGIVIDETTEVTVKTKLGIPVKFNPTEATAYNISDETLADIVGKLTKEQRAFVDEMQEYLSSTMGEKGNEVSLQMYGVKLFREKFYFPLKSATQFMAKAKEQQQGEVRIKNAGFSKETVRKANNPIVLTPFMNVWSGHVNEMSMYHAFVLPMEDLYRVYSYRTATSDTAATKSVEMFIQNAYGKGATGYIDQLLKDLNGGARTDNTTGVINKAMGLYKKGAVFASLSVVVQQPSAIARAAALVDLHNFIGPKIGPKDHKTMWAEIKKYAPVAIIKEMGYFDTNMGKSTQDYITGREYTSWDEKMKALITDSNYRDEALSKLPALADEIAWCGIWQAVKREVRDSNPGMDNRSEEFLQKVGKRFTEVIVKTQVYDSVLARSGLMRSKDTGMKMATAFMAEPTTSINMITDALLQGKRGDRRYCRKAIGAVVASQILNAILVSFVYAMRDDDEDETYWEKYMQSLGSEVIDSLNPASYIPFIRDIVSIVQGYDVERSDMSIISDLWKAVQKLDSEKVSAYRKVEDLAGSIAKCFGLPVKNIMRDVRGIWNTIMNAIGEDDEDE